jgi:hypothetical protein
MTVPYPSFSLEPPVPLNREDAREHALLLHEWLMAYPECTPLERGYIEQIVNALIELRRLARIRGTVRNQKLRNAVLYFEQQQEDDVAACLRHFDIDSPSALRGLTRTAAGCRWAINYLERLAAMIAADGTLYGRFILGAIHMQGYCARLDYLYQSEEAYTTWIDSIGAQPNPRKADVDAILNPKYIPVSFVQRGVTLWPRDPAECRARLQAVLDRELARLRALEETYRVQYEDPERAEAQDMALAKLTKDELTLLRAERIHQQAYHQAATALTKVRRQTAAAARTPAAPLRDDLALLTRAIVAASVAPDPTPPIGAPKAGSAGIAPSFGHRSADRAVIGRPVQKTRAEDRPEPGRRPAPRAGLGTPVTATLARAQCSLRPPHTDPRRPKTERTRGVASRWP